MVELQGAVVQEPPYKLPQSSYYGPAFNTYNKAAAHYGRLHVTFIWKCSSCIHNARLLEVGGL